MAVAEGVNVVLLTVGDPVLETEVVAQEDGDTVPLTDNVDVIEPDTVTEDDPELETEKVTVGAPDWEALCEDDTVTVRLIKGDRELEGEKETFEVAVKDPTPVRDLRADADALVEMFAVFDGGAERVGVALNVGGGVTVDVREGNQIVPVLVTVFEGEIAALLDTKADEVVVASSVARGLGEGEIVPLVLAVVVDNVEMLKVAEGDREGHEADADPDAHAELLDVTDHEIVDMPDAVAIDTDGLLEGDTETLLLDESDARSVLDVVVVIVTLAEGERAVLGVVVDEMLLVLVGERVTSLVGLPVPDVETESRAEPDTVLVTETLNTVGEGVLDSRGERDDEANTDNVPNMVASGETDELNVEDLTAVPDDLTEGEELAEKEAIDLLADTEEEGDLEIRGDADVSLLLLEKPLDDGDTEGEPDGREVKLWEGLTVRDVILLVETEGEVDTELDAVLKGEAVMDCAPLGETKPVVERLGDADDEVEMVLLTVNVPSKLAEGDVDVDSVGMIDSEITDDFDTKGDCVVLSDTVPRLLGLGLTESDVDAVPVGSFVGDTVFDEERLTVGVTVVDDDTLELNDSVTPLEGV